MRAELFFERRKLGLGRQVPVEQQVHDFFETSVRGEVVYVVSAEGQPPFFSFDITEQRVSDDHAFKAAVDDNTGE